MTPTPDKSNDRQAKADADALTEAREPTPAPNLVEPDSDPMAKLAAAVGINDPAALQAIIEAATRQLRTEFTAESDALRAEMAAMKMQGHEGAVQDLNDTMGGYPWMYYRIPQDFPDEQRRGWITVGPGGSGKDGNRDAGSYNRYLRKGFLPITKYGKCPVPTDPRASMGFIQFVKAGGAQEFPPHQLVAYNWHKKNPFARLGVRFPQLTPEIMESLIGFTCEYCGFEMDFMPGDKMAGTAYRTHLINADKIGFKEAIEAVKAAGLTTTPFRAVRGAEAAIAASRPD